MASVSSINSNSSGSLAPNPPPRIHSRPNQPPPPPPLPTVPPVPPARDSSIAMTKTIGRSNNMESAPNIRINQLNNHRTNNNNNNVSHNNNNNDNKLLRGTRSAIIGPAIGERFLFQFEKMFKPVEELPPADTFVRRQRPTNPNVSF